MLFGNKNVGETPLQFLDRMRIEHPEIAHEKLSYAGRLDPMAHGQMMVLVGNEVHDREKYLACDKEYIAQFLIGIATDTGDALGIITEQGANSFDEVEARETLEKIKNLTEQTYPWFSGKTVDGVKLFDHFKSGNMHIVRPKLSVRIHDAELLELRTVPVSEIQKHIFDSIALVSGDFRQAEITSAWKAFFTSQTDSFTMVTARFIVSSGTFIRALPELFPVPAVVYDLHRTRIILPVGTV